MLDTGRLTRTVALVLAIACALVAAPLIGPIIVGAWTAHIAQPLVDRLGRRFGGRRRLAAAVVTTGFVLISLAAVAGTINLFLSSVIDLAPALPDSWSRDGIADWLEQSAPADASGWLSIGATYFGRALVALVTTIGASLALLTQLLVLVTALYGFAAYDPELRAWLGGVAPDAIPLVRRLADAFYETGRGLLIGAGLTAVAQGAVAIALFGLVGVPQFAIFGLLTGVASLLPVVGTPLVWAPLAVMLMANDRVETGVLVIGAGAIVSVVDNVLRPVMSRYAQLRMSYPVLLISTLAGIEVLGTWGMVLGPLVVRVAVEAINLVREHEAGAAKTPAAPAA